MVASTHANGTALPASTIANIASLSILPPVSSSSEVDASSNVFISTNTPVEPPHDVDNVEIPTTEFTVDFTDNETWAINFYECAAEGDLECIEEILDSNLVGVNDVDVDGFTALMVAAAEGHCHVVHMLLRRGADVSIRTHELCSTALHFAAKNGDAEIVEALCASDANLVDNWNVNADTPLIWACIEGHAEAVKVLLKYGSNVNVLNQYGASTLMCAVMIGEDPEQDKASDKERAEILTMLLEHNEKLVNFQDREGSSAMHLAASCGYLECVKTLLAFGAEITLRNVIGQTPLEEAQDSKLRESGPCVEYLRGIWQQLEEEAAARMMAMLEMEEEADKSATGGVGGPTGAVLSRKSKKKSKKAKRKVAAKQYQQLRQEDDLGLADVKDNEAEQDESQDSKVVSTKPKISQSTAAETDLDALIASSNGVKAKDNEVNFAKSDEAEDAPVQNLLVASGQNRNDDHGGHHLKRNVSHSAGATDEDVAQKVQIEMTPSAGAWTTVGKKHRSAIAAFTNPVVNPPVILRHENATLPNTTRKMYPAVSVDTAPYASRRKLNYRPENVQKGFVTSGQTSLIASAPASIKQQCTVVDAPARSQDRKWGKTSGFFVKSRSTSLPLLNPNALAFGSLGLTTGSTETSSVSSYAETSASRLSISSVSPWRSSCHGSSPAPCTVASSSSSSPAGLHYTSAGRLPLKHQRANGYHQDAREIRDRWVNKLRLSNESVAETLSYLACGVCGELVNDNLQCSGIMSRIFDGKTSSTCPQLYCASCLEVSAFPVANSTLFNCVRCHEMIPKDSMTCNSFAQAQAASLGLSRPNLAGARTQEDTSRYGLINMQHLLEMSDPRICAVDLHAFHLVPGSDLSTLSNGQLEVLESVHQRALVQIIDQRLAHARALERLQMEEWLKIQRDVLHFAPR